MTLLSPNFIITREDQVVDPVTLYTQELTLGRQNDCEIVLNHPSVSRLHAAINLIDGKFYLINLSLSHPVTLNGKLVEFNDAEELAERDAAQIGSFLLSMRRDGDALKINVQVQVAVNIAEVSDDANQEKPELALTAESTAASPDVGDALKEYWGKRSRDKMARPSPLHPRPPTRPGKAQFNWTPTRDLIHPWRLSVFVWAIILIAAISGGAALWYTNAFSPAPISRSHAQASLVHVTPATTIAKRPNANSCSNCHAISVPMEANCASCHETTAFVATLTGIPAHAAAGIGCNSCHSEHQGADFFPAESAVTACAKCHNDENKELYRGHRVFTPHGGTVGYPVVAGKWTWKGLNDEEWKQRPDAMADAVKKASERLPGESEDKWRSRQFHVLHIYSVGARDFGLAGNEAGEMSCSSCHTSFDPIDRTTPVTTCVRCHNGDNGPVESVGQRSLVAAGAPNCVSCHVQHVKKPGNWKPRLLAPS